MALLFGERWCWQYYLYTIPTSCQHLIATFSGFGYVSLMPSTKPKLLLVVGEELLKRIDDFRFKQRFHSRAEAIRHLLKDSLDRYQKPPRK